MVRPLVWTRPYSVVVRTHSIVCIFHKKIEGNAMFLLSLETIPKFTPTTVISRKSYQLLRKVIGYWKRIFPAHKHLSFKTFTVPSKALLKFLCNFTWKITQETIFVCLLSHFVLHWDAKSWGCPLDRRSQNFKNFLGQVITHLYGPWIGSLPVCRHPPTNPT